MKKIIKDMVDISASATMIPSISGVIDNAGLGNVGKAAKDLTVLGFSIGAYKKLGGK